MSFKRKNGNKANLSISSQLYITKPVTSLFPPTIASVEICRSVVKFSLSIKVNIIVIILGNLQCSHTYKWLFTTEMLFIKYLLQNLSCYLSILPMVLAKCQRRISYLRQVLIPTEICILPYIVKLYQSY